MLRGFRSRWAAVLILGILALLSACGGSNPGASTGGATPAAPEAPTAAVATTAPEAAATTAPEAATSAPTTGTEATSAPAATASTAKELSGKISFYPQNYYNPDAQPEAAKVVQSMVEKYQQAQPKVSVELVPYVGASDQYRPWLLTRLSAGQAPNITWEQYSDRNSEGSEVWVPLTDYLQKPNPYVPAGQPGSEHWADMFPDYVLAQTRAGDGNWYEIAADWVETGLFYNKDVFKQANIEPKWSNLSDFITSCKALRSAGVEPVGMVITPGWSTYQWLDDVFFTSAFSDIGPQWYLDKYNVPGRDFRRLNSEEFAKAVHDGKFSTKDERFDVYLKLVKEFADNCLMKGFAGGTSAEDVQHLFVEGKVAMVWLTTSDALTLKKDAKFDYGLTYLPPITKAENPFAAQEKTSYRVGGPSGPAQYGITKATADAGLADVAVDFLMYWTAPQNFQEVYNSYPNQMPVIEGVQPSEIVQQFQFVASMPERLIGDPIARLTQQFGTEHNRLFQQYMLGDIDAAALKEQYQPLLEQGVTDACTNNKTWDWCQK